MAFDVYTDDGVLHRNVPSIEMPANAGKTAYKKFVAENDIPSAPGEVETEEKTVTPTESVQTVNPSTGKLLSKVTVQRIPTQYVVPSGTKEITSNGSNIDISQYKYVHVNVQAAGAPTLSATYNGSAVVIGTDIDTLHSSIMVTVAFSNGDEIALGDDEYNLTGSIAVEGGNVLTVSFGGMMAQFTVQGFVPAPVLDHLTASYTGGTVPAGTTLAQLTGITVKAVYDDDSEVELTASQYQLSGTLTAGQTNTVTVTGLGDYAGKTATFSVTVEQEASGILMLNGFQTSTSKQGDKMYIVLEGGQQLPSTINKVTMKVVHKTSTPYVNNVAIHYARLLRSPTDGKLYPYYIEDYDPDDGTTSVVAMPANPEVVADQRASHAGETIPDALEWGADLTGNPIMVHYLYSVRRSGSGVWSTTSANYFAGQQDNPATYKVSYDVTFYADADAEEVHLHD